MGRTSQSANLPHNFWVVSQQLGVGCAGAVSFLGAAFFIYATSKNKARCRFMKSKGKLIAVVLIAICLTVSGVALVLDMPISTQNSVQTVYAAEDTSALWDGTANIAWYVSETNAGTEADPYEIATAEGLAGLAEIVTTGTGSSIPYDNNPSSATYGQVGNNFLSVGSYAATNFRNKYLKLTKNILLNTWNGNAVMALTDFSNANKTGGAPINWKPIGGSSGMFLGIFDGNGKSINGLVNGNRTFGLFNNIGRYEEYYGEHYDVYYGEVKNLTIGSGYLSSDGYLGMIAYQNYGAITNCVNYGNILGGVNGGIACQNYGAITNCVNNGSISSVFPSGGIASTNRGTIKRCVNNGSILGGYSSGGISAINAGGVIEECKNVGNVTSYTAAGGIVGENDAGDSVAKVIGSVNTGTVTGETGDVGGIIGKNYAPTFSHTASVLYSYNIGAVSGGANNGGIIGYDERGTVRYCYYNSTVASDISAFGVGSSATVLGLTTAQMLSSASSFGSGFANEFINAENSDGEKIWKAVDGSYPQFANEFLGAIKMAGSGTVNMANWTYGQTANNPIINSLTNPSYVITYLGRDETIYVETSTKPASAGKYTVKVVFAETENYTAYTTSTDFQILAQGIIDPNDPNKTDISGKITIEFSGWVDSTSYSQRARFNRQTNKYDDSKEEEFYVKYDGNAKRPTVTITYPSSWQGFNVNTDLQISYSNNTNVGTATVTVIGVGEYKGSQSINFYIVNELPHEVFSRKQDENGDLGQRIICLIIGLIVAVIGIFTFRGRKKSLTRSGALLFCVDRTPQQEALFWKSYAFNRYAGTMVKIRKNINVRYGIALGIMIVGMLIGGLVGGGGFVAGILLYVAAAMVSFVVDIARAFNKKRYTQSAQDWKKCDCIKCGGSAEIIESKFNRTETEMKEVVIQGKYSGDGEVISVTQRYNQSKQQTETVAHVKFTYHIYDVKRKCGTCGDISESEEASDTPPEVVGNITNIHIENLTAEKVADTIQNNVNIEYNEAPPPPPLPHVFCQFCGGKNKGEATSCEHCGGKIFRE